MAMTPFQQLESGIAFLERAVPSASGWVVNLSGLRQLTPVTMRVLGRFWREQESPQNVLGAATARVLSGFHASCAPWGVLVQSVRGILQFHWLMPGGAVGALTWASTADAAFPGAGFVVKEESSGIMDAIQSHRHAAAFVARHPRKLERNVHFSPDLARLATAMRGGDWSYVLLAQPVPATMFAREVEGIRRTEQEARRTWMRRGTSEENNHPRARHYLELLEAEHERYLEGADAGLWDVQACLLADDSQTLAAGTIALRGQLATASLSLRSWSAVACGVNGCDSTAISRLTAREAAALVPLPTEDCAGAPVRQRVAFALDGASVTNGAAVGVGRVIADGRVTQHWLELLVQEMTRHALVCGSTRSGKSQTCQYLLRQLKEQYHIPFLVLDPAKSDYRRLLRSPLGADLRIFTPGLAGGVGFPFNPLAVPRGVPAQMHMDGIRDLLLAAFGWVEPMPSVLTIALEIVYRARGWDLERGTHPKGWVPEAMPRITDLIEAIPVVVDKLGWTGEAASTLRAGPVTRLNSLLTGSRLTVLNARQSLDIRWLLEKPTVIEMGWFGTDEDRAFLLGALVLALSNVRQTDGTSAHLKHVTLIEEAHCLLAAPPSTGGHEHAQPQQKAVRQFCNLLSGIGGYGEGLVVVEQVPTKLAPDMLANTGLKIAHQLPLDADCKAVGAAMTLREDQRQFLRSLQKGEAVAFRAGDYGAFHITVPDHAGKLGFASLNIEIAEVVAHMASRLSASAA